MKLIVTMKTGNEAFFGDKKAEVMRCLNRVLERYQRGDTAGKVMDANGQSVGTFEIEEDE